MEKVSEAIQQYIKDKMENDPLFKDIKIIFSDTSVPGEGEHKVIITTYFYYSSLNLVLIAGPPIFRQILDFIRQQRQQPNYNHATKHCFFGSDADLLFLGLSLHEPYFTVLREDDGTAYTKWKDMINAKPSNAVFVGRLPKYFTEDNLHTLASFFGTVDKHVLSKDVDGTTKGFAACDSFFARQAPDIYFLLFVCSLALGLFDLRNNQLQQRWRRLMSG
jgi:hypothetical protein